METGILKLCGTKIRYSFLKDHNNRWAQFLYTIIPENPEKISGQIMEVEQAETELYKLFNINHKTTAWKRIFSSDLITHYNEIMNYKYRQHTDFFMSLTEQPPASNVKIALLGLCLSNIKDNSKFRDNNIFYFDTTLGIRHIFFEQLIDPEANEHSDSETQTKKIFSILKDKLLAFNTSIEESVLRTWIYTPHVDADYQGIVKARKELFDSINLTKDTHYIASTGIQGGSGNQFARVSMDVYAVIGIKKEDIRYIQAPEYLSPTYLYGVTFERATAARLGKSDFLFISGTASIDKEGKIVYPGDVVKQTEHTLKNISAILDSAKFTVKDLSSFIIYLRDAADYSFIKPQIDKYSSNLPTIYVKAPVCRPGWLIEIEATAAKIAD